MDNSCFVAVDYYTELGEARAEAVEEVRNAVAVVVEEIWVSPFHQLDLFYDVFRLLFSFRSML